MTGDGELTGLVLAGGAGSRLGSLKQLLPIDGRPMLQHVIDTAASELDDVVVVLGHGADLVAAQLRLPPGTRSVINADHEEGQAASLRTGLTAARSDAPAVVVLLGDEPNLQAAAVRAVVRAYRATGGPVVQPRYGGHPGHPVVLAREVWKHVSSLRGDVGARTLLARHPEWIVAVDLPGDSPTDVDTWEDFRRLSRVARAPAPPPAS